MNIYTVLSSLLIILYWIFIAIISIRIIMRRKPISYSVSWLFVIGLFPVIGAILYISVGESRLGSKRAKRAEKILPALTRWFAEVEKTPDYFSNETSQLAQSLFNLCKNITKMDGIKFNQVELFHQSAEAIKQIIFDIDHAKTSIVMEFYIWDEKGFVENIHQALINAKKRGISCQIILDSVGSHHFLKSIDCQKLKNAGIEIVEALEANLFRSFFRRIDIRQHRKMIIIDEKISYTGSMNMVDPKFFKQNAGVGEWIDIMIRIVGPGSAIMKMIFNTDWLMETSELRSPPIPYCGKKENTIDLLQFIASGPGFYEDFIEKTLLTAIYSANKTLVMTSPYFVPSEQLLNAICTAADRGVNVHIILPKKNDSNLVYWASRAYFTELLSHNIKIHEFSGGLLHTKSVLIDDELSLIGTVNLDMRSLWLNFELTVIIDDLLFSQKVKNLQEEYIKNSTLLMQKTWKNRPFWSPFIERIFYIFSPLL